MYDLTAFDAHNYGPQKRRAVAAEYSFPNLSDGRARSAGLGAAVGDLLQSAMIFGGIDVLPFTIHGENLVVVACRAYRTVGITVIDPTGDTARDVVTWMEPTQEERAAHLVEIEPLRNAHAAGIDHVIVQRGTATETIYEALGTRPVEATA
ncbi:hypothetical protein ACFV1C_22175 [Streptomyces sp. NPDC059605]|uniref:hypothetical protein n=1 Tax=unclassified Streptomyces TaxID=2593676 RepID=UPI0036AABCDD